MNIKDTDIRYLLLAIVIILVDRATKWIALHALQQPLQITGLLRFQLVFNRGVSWGLFHSDQPLAFSLLSLLIGAIIIGLLCYTVVQRINRKPIYGEVAILAGASSNLVDRFAYGGVIDFIRLSYNSWSWPVFNVADMAIVLGVMWILWEHYRSHE